MITPTLATPEDQAEWAQLAVDERDVTTRLNAIRHRRNAIASRAMVLHLQAGKWVVRHPYLKPVDARARLQIDAILTTALGLGYHDQFTLYSTWGESGEVDSGVRLEGRIDDGDVALEIMITPRIMSKALTEDGVVAAMKTLAVDVDLSAFVDMVRKEEQARARRALDEAQRTLARLQGTP